MAQKRLGLSMRVVKAQGYNEQRDAISHDWFDLLQSWECTPILIPNKVINLESYLSNLSLDGIILTGGNNLSPQYAGHPEWSMSDTALLRDGVEYQLLDYAAEGNIPVFGVCRGLQVINTYFGGALTLANPEIHVAKTHSVQFQGTLWEKVLGKKATVNSYHNYGISRESLAKKIYSFAFDKNGLIEAAVHRSLPIMGVMWHPEREQPGQLPNKIIFSRLLNEGSFWTA